MKSDSEGSFVQDAVASIQLHFMEIGGLISQIEEDGEINEASILVVEKSLKRIQEQWEKEDSVPKSIVKLFINVIPRLERCILLFPDKATQLRNFSINVSTWINDLFLESDQSEQQAIGLLCQHVFGTPPLCIELYHSRINEDAVQELFESLETLAHKWKSQQFIPKFAAHAVFGAQELMTAAPSFFAPSKKQQLLDSEQKLTHLIVRCLTENS